MISKTLCASVGGGVVAEMFRDLRNHTPIRDSVGGGGCSAELFFSVTSKRHFPLMGPFFFFTFPKGGTGPLNRPLIYEYDPVHILDKSITTTKWSHNVWIISYIAPKTKHVPPIAGLCTIHWMSISCWTHIGVNITAFGRKLTPF